MKVVRGFRFLRAGVTPAHWLASLAVCIVALSMGSQTVQAQECIDASGGSFTVDYPMVEITPELQLNGAPFMNNEPQSVQIWLAQDGVLQRRIADSHRTPSPTRIVADRYDIVYRNITKTDPSLPQNTEAIIQRDVVIKSDGVLVVDIPSVQMAGTVTLNGSAFSKSPLEDGNLFAVSTAEGDSVPLGHTSDGPAGMTPFGSYVVPGEYEIVFRNESGKTLVPVNSNALIATIDLKTSQTNLALNLVAHPVSGDFFFNSVATPASALEHGEIELRRKTPGGLLDTAVLGDTADQSYTTMAAFGSYDVYYTKLLAGTVAPRNNLVIVRQNVRVQGAPIDVDMAVTTMVFDMLFSGSPAPASVLERGEISVRDALTGTETTLAQTNSQSASVPLVAGTYDVFYRWLAGSTVAPRNTFALVEQDVVIPDTGGGFSFNHDIDIPVTDTSISLTLDGAAIQPANGTATIVLMNADGSLSLGLGNSSGMPWQNRLVSGNYRLQYSYATGADLPRNTGTLLPQVMATTGANDTMIFDLASIGLAPTVLIDGTAFPSDSTALLFLTGKTGAVNLGDHNGSWPSWPILQGRYSVVYTWTTGPSNPQNQLYANRCVIAELCLFCDGFEKQ